MALLEGGTIVKLFARTYPQEVAGVVLVDARDANFVQSRCGPQEHFPMFPEEC